MSDPAAAEPEEAIRRQEQRLAQLVFRQKRVRRTNLWLRVLWILGFIIALNVLLSRFGTTAGWAAGAFAVFAAMAFLSCFLPDSTGAAAVSRASRELAELRRER